MRTLRSRFSNTDSYNENVYSYANNIPTTEGGTHMTGFKTGITKVINDYARKIGTLKEADKNLSGEDVPRRNDCHRQHKAAGAAV